MAARVMWVAYFKRIIDADDTYTLQGMSEQLQIEMTEKNYDKSNTVIALSAALGGEGMALLKLIGASR